MTTDRTITFSLRLTEKWKKRLERFSAHQNVSLNQLIMDIITTHYQQEGIFNSETIQLKNGRLLELHVEKDTTHAPGVPTNVFYLYDVQREKEICRYRVGASHQLVQRFHISREDEYDFVSELGQALLHFHDTNDLDVTRLEWKQLPTMPEYRIIDTNDAKRKDGTLIASQKDFHSALATDNWRDRHLKPRLKALLSPSIALSMHIEASKLYDQELQRVASSDFLSAERLKSERDQFFEVLDGLTLEGINKLGKNDPYLNDKEVHFFSERWKPGHPDLENNRVVVEMGRGNADRAIANFYYEVASHFLPSEQPFVCRWLEGGHERERQLVAP